MASVHPSRAGMVPDSPKRNGSPSSPRKDAPNRLAPGTYSLSRLQERKEAEERAKREQAERRSRRDGRDRRDEEDRRDDEQPRGGPSLRDRLGSRSPREHRSERRDDSVKNGRDRDDYDRRPRDEDYRPQHLDNRHDRPPHLDAPSSSRHRGDSYVPSRDHRPHDSRSREDHPLHDRGPRHDRRPHYDDPRDDRPRRGSPSYRPFQPEPAPVVNAPIRLGFDDAPPLGLPPWKPTMKPQDRDREQEHDRGRDRTQQERQTPASLELRRQQREQAVVNIWPDSPPQPYSELVSDDKDRKKSRKRRSRRYSSSSGEEDESERRRRERRRREKEKEREKERARRKRSRSKLESEDGRGRSSSRVDSGNEGRSKSRALSPEWVESGKTPDVRDEEDDGPVVGPLAPAEIRDRLSRDAFHNLLPGEGEAMAAYLQNGERIPRRGEIGLDASRIQQFEDAGYVMSGSRHQRMTAVRLRKEGQVANAEEKRALLKLQREQKEQKEGAIISQFKEMMDERLKAEERREREERERQRGREGRDKERERRR